MSIKTTIILASSLAALPIAILLIGSAIQKRKRNSTLTREFLKQPKSSTADNNTTTVARATHVQHPEEISQWPLPTPSQRSETNTATTAKDSSNISTEGIPNPKDIPIALESPIVPSSTPASGVIVSRETPNEDETSLSDHSKETGESLRELIVAAVKEAKDSAKETGYSVKEDTIDVSATAGSKVIRPLGGHDDARAQVNLFEETMSAIRKESYDNQIKLLDSYKALLQKQIMVVHARSKIARTLKAGS